MPLSSRHHYIPEFFIKGFTGIDGKVTVFDVQKGEILSARKSAKQIFYEWNRNLFEVHGLDTDFVENLYSKSDNDFATLFNTIKAQKIPQLDVLQKFKLILFVGQTYWRIPKTDENIQNFIQNSTKDDLYIKIYNRTSKKEAPDEIYDWMFNHKAFIGAYRGLKPLFDWAKGNMVEEFDFWNIYYAGNSNELHLLGDNPFILKNDNVDNIYTTELIFPLTKGKKLVHIKGTKPQSLPREHSVRIDVLTCLQSQKYVCGPDESYLKAVVLLAEKYNSNEGINLLKREIFDAYY